VEEIVAHWGLELEVTSRIDADTVWISFTGADAALLTDDDGRILEALQYLVSKMSSRLLADNVRVLLDAAGFRHERDEALRAMAFDAAARAIERGKPIRLEPLNAYERRVIHIALQDKPGVRTYSLGRGYFKRVTIEPVEAADARADQPGAAAHAGTAAPAGAAAADLDNDDTPAPSDDDDE
jgi:spoIIIJ-associated protein